MDDELVGNEEDATYEDEDDWSKGSEDQMSMDGDEFSISPAELKFLEPSKPFNHENCIESLCERGISTVLRREGQELGFGMSFVPVILFKVSC